jgi:hypothetical protein
LFLTCIDPDPERNLTMKASDVFPSKFLKKEDAQKPLRLVIESVVMEEVSGDGGKESKPVMYFRHDQAKPMIVNRGNWMILEEGYGEDSDDWAGKTVEVYLDPSVMFGGKRIGGLRVRIPAGAGTGGSPPAAEPTWATIDEAVKAANGVVSKETIVSHLKGLGVAGWNPAKCTPIVKQLIEECSTAPF